MDLSTQALLGVVATMALNQLVIRLGGVTIRWIFWPAQLINLGVGTAILAYGMPGFEQMPAVSWFLGLVFFLRVLQNNHVRAEIIRRHLEGSPDEEQEQKKAKILERRKS